MVGYTSCHMDLYEHGYTANLRTNVMDFRGLNSSMILIIRGGIPMPKGDFPESLSQAIILVVGIMLVGRLGASWLVIRLRLCGLVRTYMLITHGYMNH